MPLLHATASITVTYTGHVRHWIGHWGYMSLSKPYDGACLLSPLPEHSGDGSCSGGRIPNGGSCTPQCTTGRMSGSHVTASCGTEGDGSGYADVAYGQWKAMCEPEPRWTPCDLNTCECLGVKLGQLRTGALNLKGQGRFEGNDFVLSMCAPVGPTAVSSCGSRNTLATQASFVGLASPCMQIGDTSSMAAHIWPQNDGSIALAVRYNHIFGDGYGDENFVEILFIKGADKLPGNVTKIEDGIFVRGDCDTPGCKGYQVIWKGLDALGPTPTPFVCCDQFASQSDWCQFPCFHGHCTEEIHFPDPREWCECEPDYEGTECRFPAKRRDISWLCWLCAVVTLAGIVSLLITIPWLRSNMRSLRRLKLPTGDNAQGALGLCLFVLGVGDLLLSMKTAVNLYECDELPEHGALFACFASSLVATVGATVYLSCCTLIVIRQDVHDRPRPSERVARQRGDASSDDCDSGRITTDSSTSVGSTLSVALSDTTRWVVNDRGKLPLILILSSTRFSSLAILRLRLCGHTVLDYPMQDEHLHFLRNAGLFKHLVADIPGALICGVLLYASDKNTEACGEPDDVMSAVNVATAMLWCKLFLVVWSCAKSLSQLLLTGVYGVDQPNKNAFENARGELQVETALSVLWHSPISWVGGGGERDTRVAFLAAEGSSEDVGAAILINGSE